MECEEWKDIEEFKGCYEECEDMFKGTVKQVTERINKLIDQKKHDKVSK